jgi:hypothetical protein
LALTLLSEFRIHCGASAGLGCNQVTASREGDLLRFHLIPNCQRLNNEFAGNGGSIVELIPPADNQLGIRARLWPDAYVSEASLAGFDFRYQAGNWRRRPAPGYHSHDSRSGVRVYG